MVSALLGHRRSALRGPIAGVDLGSTAVRVVLLHGGDGRPRLVAAERAALRSGCVVRGVVRDPTAVAEAVRETLAHAETRAGHAASEVLVALAGDDLRTHHAACRVMRPAQMALRPPDIARTGRDAARRATAGAVALFSDEPGLRGIALQPLETLTTAATLDGRRVDGARGQRGGTLDVGAVAALLPTVHASTAELAVKGLRRSTRFIAAPVALGALVAEAGPADVVLIDCGAQMTNVAVIVGGAVLGARSLSISASELERRPPHERDRDARVWARCVVVAARAIAGEATLPPGALLAGGAADADGVLDALRDALRSRSAGAEPRVERFTPDLIMSVVEADGPSLEHLVAIAAARAGIEQRS